MSRLEGFGVSGDTGTLWVWIRGLSSSRFAGPDLRALLQGFAFGLSDSGALHL